LFGWLTFAIGGSHVSDSLSRPCTIKCLKKKKREREVTARGKGTYFD